MARTRTRADQTFSADPRDFERLLTFRINRLAETLERSATQQFLAKHGLNIAEWRVLLLVNRFGSITAKEICRIATMDKVRVSRAVSNLLKRRLLEQAQDVEDRRRTILTPTPRGKTVFEAVWPIARARQENLLALFSADELRVLSSLMARLHARAEEILGEPRPDKRPNATKPRL